MKESLFFYLGYEQFSYVSEQLKAVLFYLQHYNKALLEVNCGIN